jgi:ribonucleoside-diphosphate reductase alpha chain
MPNNHFPTLYQEVIHKSRYARWIQSTQQRENWAETIGRYFDWFTDHLEKNNNYKLDSKLRKSLETAMINLEIQPSMRTLMTAGPALDSCLLANFNCAALPIDSSRSFSEHMFVLMSGAGSGFSVERRFVDKLPEVPSELYPTETIIVVSDSRKGWAIGYNQFLNVLYAGSIPKWDMSRVRPEGSRLKTFGGYSSGPGVLEELFEHTIEIFKNAQGRRLTPREAFSLCTYIAQVVVVGGVRRSATIALFDKDDNEMRQIKSGSWWLKNPHYAMANISAVFEHKPESLEFMDFWRDLMASGSGEPGFKNRYAAWKSFEEIGRATRNEKGERISILSNPCMEIELRPYQFCNLSAICIRPTDTLETLKNKIEMATILGTWQATISDFDYLRKIWIENTKEEALLGVCLSGVMDHPILSKVTEESAAWLKEMRDLVWKINKAWAKLLNINPSASVTSLKPAGNSSELMNTSSGIHPRYSPYYIRTIRQSSGDPMTKFLQDEGIPWEVSKQNHRDIVFSFPIKSPDTSICIKDITAIQQLEHWLHIKKNYATHTISCTIYIGKDDWMEVGAWVYRHFDDLTGLSFLPFDDHTYEQAPFQPITKEEFEELDAKIPKEIDWNKLKNYESEDTTRVSQEYTCSAAGCTI